MATLRPGHSLGFLKLGMPLQRVIATLRALPGSFPRIEISFNEQKPLLDKVVVLLESNGLRLHFDGREQYLRLVEVIQWGAIKITYKGHEIGRQGAPAFRSLYSKVFGPTYPGQHHRSSGTFVLSYPGVAFRFDIPDDVDIETSDEMIKYLSAADAPTASSMAIFIGSSWEDAAPTLFDFSNELNGFHLDEPHSNGNANGGGVGNGSSDRNSTVATGLNLQDPVVKSLSASSTIEVSYVEFDPPDPDVTIYFWKHTQNISQFEIAITKTTLQDILMALGPPSERLFKQDSSRLSIHNPSDGSDYARTDLFFNYFRLGIDIGFDTMQHNSPVKKLVLHGNVPGSLAFQKYNRCRWQLGSITSEDPFPSYSKSLISDARPMVLNRTLESPSSSVELVGDGDADEEVNDWGLTDLFGSKGCIFEVLKNGSVASITIY